MAGFPPRLSCIACGRVLENFSSGCVQPMGGLSLETPGHYGSSFFDGEGTILCVVACDECLRRAERDRPDDSPAVVRVRAVRPRTTYERVMPDERLSLDEMFADSEGRT